MAPYTDVPATPYQFPRNSDYAAGLPTCPNDGNYLPVLTGPQNMYYMVGCYSIDMFNQMTPPCSKGGHWNNWLSILPMNNGTNKPVMIAAYLPGNCPNVQDNSIRGKGPNKVGVPIWFDDGGAGGDPVMLSYVDSVTNVWVGNAYRVCTFGYTGIEEQYPSPACGNAISNSPQTQAGSPSYCYGCSPSQKTVLYLSWGDDNADDNAVIMGWTRPTCASVSQSLSYHCLCEDINDCGGNSNNAFPSLRGNAVNFFFSLGNYLASTPSYAPIPSWHAPYLGMGETFIMSMQGSYLSSPNGKIQSWTNSYPQSAFFKSYGPVGDGDNNNLKDWPIYCYFPVRANSPQYSLNSSYAAYFQVAPLGNGSFPTPSNYCISPPKGASYDQWCGGKSLTDFTTANPTCTPNHVSCIRNTYFSGWSCLGQSAGGGGGGGSCSGKCVSVPNVCDATGQCSNSLFYTPECNQGKWSCGKKTTSWVAVIIAILILLLIMIWVFMG